MTTQDLHVKIPVRFKEQLERRFPDPATIPEGVTKLEFFCPMCDYFGRRNVIPGTLWVPDVEAK